MSDLIDRQQAIDAVKIGALSAATIYGRTDEGSTALHETVRAIKALPSAQPKPQWIPRSKRLPEENGEYLVTRESSSYRYIDIVRKSNCNSHLPMASDIKAWMPLPEPYAERRSDE